jgi:hypothetical protein
VCGFAYAEAVFSSICYPIAMNKFSAELAATTNSLYHFIMPDSYVVEERHGVYFLTFQVVACVDIFTIGRAAFSAAVYL